MSELCQCLACRQPAVDEYHWWEDVEPHKGVRIVVEVCWPLCDTHCDFALEMVEWISNLDDEEERDTWTLND